VLNLVITLLCYFVTLLLNCGEIWNGPFFLRMFLDSPIWKGIYPMTLRLTCVLLFHKHIIQQNSGECKRRKVRKLHFQRKEFEFFSLTISNKKRNKRERKKNTLTTQHNKFCFVSCSNPETTL
jgi:hypothetical protein